MLAAMGMAATTVLAVILVSLFDVSGTALVLSGGGFWLVVWLRPGCIDLGYLVCPRNYATGLFFLSCVVAPPILLLSGTWIILWAPYFWSYLNLTLILWLIAFAAYAVGVGATLPELGIAPSRADIEARPWRKWMLYGGLVLMPLGIIGLSLAAGSFGEVLAVRGMRAAAQEIIAVPGRGRFLVWFWGTSFGCALLWYYLYRRWNLGRFGAFVLLLALYVPLIPLYSFTSGRGDTLIPVAMLVALYYRFCHRFSGWWLVAAFSTLLPLAFFWSIYRLGGGLLLGEAPLMDGILREGIAVFTRLDVSVAAIAGFHEGNLPYLYGETVLAALEHPIPQRLLGERHFLGGTMAMAQAIFADPSWNEPSALATPLMVEGYLNFGVVGVVLFSAGLGILTRLAERMYLSRDLLIVVTGVAVTFHLPFGAALQVILAGAVWKVGFPFLLALFVRDSMVLASRRKRSQAAEPVNERTT